MRSLLVEPKRSFVEKNGTICNKMENYIYICDNSVKEKMLKEGTRPLSTLKTGFYGNIHRGIRS